MRIERRPAAASCVRGGEDVACEQDNTGLAVTSVVDHGLVVADPAAPQLLPASGVACSSTNHAYEERLHALSDYFILMRKVLGARDGSQLRFVMSLEGYCAWVVHGLWSYHGSFTINRMSHSVASNCVVY